ncbi:hypothetical protein GF359_04875 [candidate division WOR-3 bacterium]|uniref:Zn-dependent metallo-hydrolase RNA specificity domain-containing protein n=1 Tax=candidate division WOR-3 bacterium TaxID=2052148 RepID=A0A9D5QCC6_UNCW3|nr:hypothetical protein [candidate division WOR-3 bacterium]MBD3364528.1 hypothetical protein [candidate division WOR-3 bacterium]
MKVCPEGRVEFSGTAIMLDRAARNGEPVIVSHAHADHTVRKGRILASPETKRLLEVRYRTKDCKGLSYGKPYGLDGVKITLYPSGHILGSAQVLLKDNRTSLLYSGDIKLRRPSSCAPIEIPHAENLIVEATFGTHLFQWPRIEKIIGQIDKFIADCRRLSKTPVFLAYSLGKSQELLSILKDFDQPVSVSQTVFQMSKVYEEFGIDLGTYTLYEDEEVVPGILVIPPQKARHLKLAKPRFAMVTGWALSRNGSRRIQIPLSDHADFGELLRYVDKVNPRRVWTTHGYARELATALRHRGYAAQELEEASDVNLSLSL